MFPHQSNTLGIDESLTVPSERYLLLRLLLILGLFVSSLLHTSVSAQPNKIGLPARQVVARSGLHYTIIDQGSSLAEWSLKRPSKNDGSVLLCIAAAFTESNGAVDGMHAVDGKFFNYGKPDVNIGGVVACMKGNCTIEAAPQGELNGALLKKLVATKGDLFQQFYVVVDSKPEKFKDKSRFQRRAITSFADGHCAVIESTESITLTQFASDLAELGVRRAAYTDMGPWDEGWYHNATTNKVITIGQDRSLTYRQSNWFTFMKNTACK